MQVTISKLKKIIKEELVRMAEVDASISENQKQALGALTKLTIEEASTVISLYESVATDKA